MRLCEINPGTTVGMYDCETGEYHTLGSGFNGSDDARRAAEEEADGEYVLVAELAHIGMTLAEEEAMAQE